MKRTIDEGRGTKSSVVLANEVSGHPSSIVDSELKMNDYINMGAVK